MNVRQQTRQGRAKNERGAALVVAIAIMTILLAIALTFYGVSRVEVDNANNVRNAVQDDLLVDASLAIAMAELNRDFLKHPNATSTDFKPFSLFNGSWAVAKQRALRNTVPLQAGGVPLVDFSDLPEIEWADGYREALYQGPLSKDWLYYPRFEGATVYMYVADPVNNPVTRALIPGTNTDFTQYRDGTPFFFQNFDVSSANRPPFVTPAVYGLGFGDVDGNGTFGLEAPGYPLEMIHSWTDVDNDLDGFNDSLWIPIPQDKFFSGGEVINDITGRRMFDDGIDNNLNGTVDENPENGIDDDGINGIDDPGEAMELGTFVYWGGNDGLDNDGDGQVDEPNDISVSGEQDYFLTCPLPGITIPIDFNADGIVPDMVPDAAGRLVPLTVTLPNAITVALAGGGSIVRTAAHVDRIDNDYDMLINDYQVYAYVGPNALNGPPFRLRGFEDTGVPDGSGRSIIQAIVNINGNNGNLPGFATAQLKSYEVINPAVFTANLTITPAFGDGFYDPSFSTFDYQALLPGTLVITHAGEPVCDLAGRAAILVRDEGGKMNMNVAGAHQFNPELPVVNNIQDAFPDPLLGYPIMPAIHRSLGLGATTAEIETRALPNVGVGTAAKFWAQRTGAPEGNPDTWDPTVTGVFYPDVVYPGYGRVDDNANILVSAFNGKDDDGDGLVDEGLYLPPLSERAETYLAGGFLSAADQAAAVYELAAKRYGEYYAELGIFEGVDEPDELQRYRALPNLQAEDRNPYRISAFVDGTDNDFDGALNERGELGDLQLQNTLQIADIFNIGQPELGRIEPFLTAYSTDRNVNFVGGRDGIRALNKLDFNFATPQQIAANLLIANPFNSPTARPLFEGPLDPDKLEINRFADGLRQADVHLRSSIFPAVPVSGTPNQGGLMWRLDINGQPRGTIPYFPADPVLQALQTAVDIVDNRDSDHSRSLLATERGKATPLTALEAGTFDFWPTRLGLRERIDDTDYFPLGEIEDHLRNTMGVDRKLQIRDEWWTFDAGVTGVYGLPEEREISYAVSGSEAIRINELMVRAVRRVEAEAIPDDFLVGVTDPMTGVGPANYNLFDPTPEGDKIVAPGNPVGSTALPQFTLARATLANSNWASAGNPYIGEGSGLATVSNNIAEGTELTGVEDVLQFLVYPTDPTDAFPDGLPSGRYYLTVKATLGGLPIQGDQLAYSIKYVDLVAGDTTIIQDLQVNAAAGNANSVYLPARWTTVPAGQVAAGKVGQPQNWVFVNGTPEPSLPFIGPDVRYFTDGGFNAEFGLPINPTGTFTVSVPQYVDTAADGIPDRALCIAFSTAPGVSDGVVLQIDALDFSQEPDHEWVELANVSDKEVNIGGWELEVGIPDRPSVPRDPFKSRWQVPSNTIVAPGGMVLLSFNKYDHYQALGGTSAQNPRANRVADNGMGLAGGVNAIDFLPHTQNLTNNPVTVPDIHDLSYNPLFTPPGLGDPTGSVFRRSFDLTGNFWDYVDRDGDGRSSIYTFATLLNGDTDSAELEGQIRSTREQQSDQTAGTPNLPWDRIVQLTCLQYAVDDPTQVTSGARRFDDIQNVDEVARLVLQGGVFPNYPEQDGFDNDGDGGYVDLVDLNGDAVLEPVYFAGTLDRDMIDNDLDFFVDERGTPFFNDGVDQPDLFGQGDLSLGDGVSQFLSEGVDEGRNVHAGEYLPGTLGAVFFNTRELGTYPADDPTVNPINYFDFNLTFVPPTYLAVNADGATGIAVGPASQAFADSLVATPVLPYMGSDADPADWKAFEERRWYPGDNVIVTLYEGLALNNRVADRVTYREYDVTNRTIDDVVDWTLFYGPGTEMNPDYPSFWRPNHMGLDFYRSLERKHPLYNGDHFGTENRWQATDGNYDDWSDSLSFYEAELASDSVANPVLLASNHLEDVRPRFPVDAAPSAAQVRNLRLFGHAIWGTPLRMNTAARITEDPADLERIPLFNADPTVDPRQFFNPLEYYRTHEDGLYDGTDYPKNGIRLPFDTATTNTVSLQNQNWNHRRAFVADRSYLSPGDLMRVPHQVFLHDAVNTNIFNAFNNNAFLRDMTMLNYGLQGDMGINDGLSYEQDIALRGATLGQDTVDQDFTPNMLAAAVDSMATETKVLTMGQAEFRPILPLATDVDTAPGLINWVQNPNSPNPDDLLAPNAWTPVFLFGMLRDTDPRVGDDQFPNYPTYVNGTYAGQPFDLHYLFNTNFLLDTANFGGTDPYYNVLNDLDRWPLEQRTAMYVSENRGGPAPPEAVFIWDGADGLENGEYTLYIGTYLPQMRARIEEAAKHAAGVVNQPAAGIVAKNTPALLSDPLAAESTLLELDDGNVLPVNRVTRAILLHDPTNPRATDGQKYEPVYAIDVITNPSEARGQAPLSSATTDPSRPGGLIHPDDWNPTVQYKAGPDGYIFYGNNAVGGWKPQIVRVTDNFLALRVRNLGGQGQLGVLTHIVLAPRKRTAGRVNVNTADSRVVTYPLPGGGQASTHEYFSTMLGLPGVVDVAQTVQPGNAPNVLAGAISPAEDIPLESFTKAALATMPPNPITGLTAWTPVAGPAWVPGGGAPFLAGQSFYGDLPVPPLRNRYSDGLGTDSDLLVTAPVPIPVIPTDMIGSNDPAEHRDGAFRLNAMIMGGRTEHADGRYYERVGDLARDTSAFDYNYLASRADRPNRTSSGPLFPNGVENGAIYPLSNESDPAKRFDEIQARFDRLSNLVTTRSDVFKVTMTVESGYGVDRNGDGFINYRSGDEFVTTARTKASAIYERRAPSDQSDGAE